MQVEAFAAQLTHREGELIQEKAEMKRLANFLKQVITKSHLFVCLSTASFARSCFNF